MSEDHKDSLFPALEYLSSSLDGYFCSFSVEIAWEIYQQFNFHFALNLYHNN